MEAFSFLYFNNLFSYVYANVLKTWLESLNNQLLSCKIAGKKEAAIIFETKSENNYNKIILVRAPLETRIERVMNRDKVSKKEVMQRIDNQLDESSIIDKCDYIIDNYNEEDLNEKVLGIHQELSV